ncbi:hypothetical protein BC943DRAFT_335259 [Umbelopsis sp. AD052]|nr:hypothetical protein BC943DRAFT_335259 [Umbelopsis sp. AD052]
MVNLATARGLNADFFKLNSASALIVGGTSGVGQSIAFKIAQYTKKPLIVVSGRDEVRGQETVDALKAINKEGSYSFEKCDVTKMKDTRNLANKMAENHQSFNLLIISSGFLSMKPRTETEDGIDEKLAVNFFGRFNLINRMMPMLTSAASQGQRVNVLSVFAAAEGRSLDLNDIGLTKNYSLSSAASHASNCNDLMVEELSERNPNISFYHAHPGIVNTNLVSTLPWYLRVATKPLLLFSKNPDDAADHLLSGLTGSNKTGGWGLLNSMGDPLKPTKFQTKEAREKVWEYSTRVTEQEEKKNTA